MRTFDVGPSTGGAVAADRRSANTASAPDDNTPAAVDLRKHLRETFVSIFILLQLMTCIHVDHFWIPRGESPASGSPSHYPSKAPAALDANPKIAGSKTPADKANVQVLGETRAGQNTPFVHLGLFRAEGLGCSARNRSKDSSPGVVITVKDKRMVATDEDRRRIVQSQNGDQGAFEALIREHQRMIHSLCYRMSGSLADADDLAQETFIHAYQHLDGFRAEARFSSWLYRIAVNQCLNWRKRRQRLDQLHTEWGEQDREPADADAGRTQQIQEALMALPPKQRAAVILTAYDGLTHAEAAAALGCSETTVSWRLFAARGKLKRLLKDHVKPDGTP